MQQQLSHSICFVLPYPGSVQQDHAVAVLLSLHDCNYHLDDCRGRRRRQTGARAYISLYVKLRDSQEEDS